MPLARRVEREIYDRPVRERVNNRNIEEKIPCIAFPLNCFYSLMLLSLKCILQAKSKRTILYSDEWTRKIPIWIFFGQQLALVHQRRDSTRQGTSSPYQNGYFDLVVWYWWFGDLNWIVLVLTIQCCPDSTWVLWMADQVIFQQLATPPYLHIVLNVF